MAAQVTFPCRALDRGLNAAILHIAGRLFPTGYDAAPDAPDTFKGLKRHLDAGKRMVVYDGFSDHTIYDDKEVNYAFRAWHDWCHWEQESDFSLDGEVKTWFRQVKMLAELYGYSEQTTRWASILHAEVVGQARYYRKHNRFIDDQRGFVEAYMADPEAALERADW